MPFSKRKRIPDQKENLQIKIDEWLEQVVIKPSVSPWALPLVPVKEEEGQADEVGQRPERAEQASSQGKLPPHEHTGDLTQSARCYSVFVFGCL